MIQFEDACVDGDLYAAWLAAGWPGGELAERVGRILREGGYTVNDEFVDTLVAIAPIDLADFIAANWPFGTDDPAWLDHCRRRYPPGPHPSQSPPERNGARTTWRR